MWNDKYFIMNLQDERMHETCKSEKDKRSLLHMYFLAMTAKGDRKRCEGGELRWADLMDKDFKRDVDLPF